MNHSNLIIDDSQRRNSLNINSKNENVSSLTNLMLSNSLYSNMMDVIDENGEPDYSHFNDIEMIYFYVHQQKDLNMKKNRKENTKKEYLRDLLLFYQQLLEQAERFEIHIEEVSNYRLLQTLNHRNIRKYQEWIKDAPLGKGGKPYSVATLNRKMVIIKGFFTFAFTNHYFEVPLHQKMLSSNVHAMDRPNKEMSSAEVIQLVDYFRTHPILYGLISVLATTGIRIQEMCKARVCDLAYLDGEYWLTIHGKGNKEREVLIHPNVLEAIKRFRLRRRLELKLDQGDHSPLFTTAKGKAYHYKYLSNYITRKINQTDLDFVKMRKNPITPHSFRHCYALISADQGADLLTISQSLGHADLKTTQIYLQRKMARRNNAAHAWKGSDIINNI
jgi:site-specific recombinase XerD